MIKIVLLFFSVEALFAIVPGTYSDEEIEELAYSEAWLKLVHYKKIAANKFESLVDGSGFFLAKDGKHNPVSELRENLRAFHNHQVKIGLEKQAPQCAFPLRYEFMKRQQKISTSPVPCKKLEKYMAKFDQKKIFLVFSSAYPNNPGSMFGHTFLRIGTSRQQVSPVLDYGLSYAAFTPIGEGGVGFAIKGIFGGYRGLFSTLPYYEKLNEYNNIEGRDIWEYELNMTPEEVRNLLYHVWEIKMNGHFDYYFLGENCAYQLLALLEAVRPTLSLTHYFLYMTPADSIKRLSSVPHLIKSIHFRPSLLRKASNYYSELSAKQKGLFDDIAQGKNISTFFDEQVLDSVISYLHYRKQGKKLDNQEREVLSHLLVRRSQLPKTKQKVTFPPPRPSNRPDIGHDPHLLQINGGITGDHFFQELRYRTSYHDLLANDKGHGRFSEIIFPSVTLRYQYSKWFLEEFNVISLTSLGPWSRLSRKLSWSMKFHLFQDRLPPRCQVKSCLKGHLSTGPGLTAHLFSKKSLISFMALLSMETGKNLGEKYSIGPKFMALFLTNPFKWYKSKISYSRFYGFQGGKNPLRRQILEWGQSFSLDRNVELRVIYSGIKEKMIRNELKIALLFYTM